MIDQQQDDPWQVPSSGHLVNDSDCRLAILEIEVTEKVEPLDAQFGASLKKTVPNPLWNLLFGHPKGTIARDDHHLSSPPQTYALLDAAKIINLPERLESSGLEHRCLFQGAAYRDLGYVAPWLVRLEEGNAFTRGLFTRGDAYWQLWDDKPGIFVRSSRTLGQMRQHFRKFTRVQDRQGKFYFMRFWVPEVLVDLAECLQPANADRFFPDDIIWIAVSDGNAIRIERHRYE